MHKLHPVSVVSVFNSCLRIDISPRTYLQQLVGAPTVVPIMTGTSANKATSPAKPRDVADPSEFLENYFRNRGIKRNIESAAIADCVRRAEEAREKFKRMRAPGAPEPVPRGGNAQSAILTDAEKYSRRLVNNRKSAAATRVYQEVLKNEQAHTLTSVVEELARSERERTLMDAETNRLRAVVDALRANNPIPVSKPSQTIQPPVSVKAGPKLGVPVLGGRSLPIAHAVVEERPVKMEMTASQEEDIKTLPVVESLSEGAGGVSHIEKRTRSLRISADFSHLHMLGSQSSQEMPIPTLPSQDAGSMPASQEVPRMPAIGSMGSQEMHMYGDTPASQDLPPTLKFGDTPAASQEAAYLKFADTPAQSQEVPSLPVHPAGSQAVPKLPVSAVSSASGGSQRIPRMPTPAASTPEFAEPKRKVKVTEKRVVKMEDVKPTTVAGPKYTTGSNLSVGVVDSQPSSQGVPVNLRFSMASQDVGEVEDVLFPTQSSQGEGAVKGFRRA